MPKEKKEKKSKKQRKKEAEERRRLEEELLRQQQEEERKRQEELERQRREEEERLRLLREKKRKEELLRLEKEREEDIDLIERRSVDLAQFIAEQREQTEWRKHLKCDPLPDISNERELNNFVTEWKETTLSAFDIAHIDRFVDDIERGYKLLSILQDVIFDAIQQQKPDALSEAKAKYLEIGGIAQSKLERLTLRMLRDDLFVSVANAGIREDGDQMRYAMKRNLKFGLWASAMSNAFKNTKLAFPAPISVSVELPKQLAMKARQPLSLRAVQSAHNFLLYEDVGAEWESVGPVLEVQLLKLPPPPRTLYGVQSDIKMPPSGWSVQTNSTQQNEQTPERYAYADARDADEKTAECISMSVTLPSYVVVEQKAHGDADSETKSIELGWWDNVECRWRVDGFKDISFECESTNSKDSDSKDKDAKSANSNSKGKVRRVSFTTCHLAPLSVVQPKGMHYEYTDWRLSPSGVERCRLSLHTRAAQSKLIEIDIVGGHCKLQSPKLASLRHILDKPLRPHQLVRLLRSCGINLCFRNDEATSPRLLAKNEAIEATAHLEVASIAALFQISMSKWNRAGADAEGKNENVIIFRLRKPLTPNEEADAMATHREEAEHAGDVGDDSLASTSKAKDDETWRTVLVDYEKCTFIDCGEQSAKLNLTTPIRELSHKTLLRCLLANCTEDNNRDLQNTSFRFKETIRRMLNLVGLFRV